MLKHPNGESERRPRLLGLAAAREVMADPRTFAARRRDFEGRCADFRFQDSMAEIGNGEKTINCT